MKDKRDMYNRLKTASDTAPLQESEKPAVKPNTGSKKSKNLHIPIELDEAYKRVRASSNTTLLFTPYILEALREKLDRDGAFE
ncbi:molecular chaperone [Xenorhabdus bovienii]|uniref:molecular chaperone n=1 Tax=Xenorhabdus bovienii TaxID=40576 RepID=UPI001EDFE4B0|nr:molecular chaperone [Xenorhabdus bovienii]MCG3472209.1 molecular chaperone [Xenorhabdus bovienii]